MSANMTLPDTLGGPSEKRLAVRVTKDAGRQIRGGHPWVYDASITSVSHDGEPGDLAVIFNSDRRFLAIGLYDPTSPLRIRVLHHGAPCTIDRAFWAARLAAALARRESLAASPDTNAYRVVHGENDAMPGFVVDRYASTYVVKLDTHAWFVHLRDLVPVLIEATGAERIVLRLSRTQRDAGEAVGLRDGYVMHGDKPPEHVLFHENGLVFDADVQRGQKTGHFLDQRDNRARARDLSSGARVLDLFSCTGGFSLHAAAGGARSVHSVDQSPHAIDAVKRNFAYNRDRPEVAACKTQGLVGDAFAVMRGLFSAGERFDIVIVDPPSFAAKATDVDAALRAYRLLTELAVGLVDRQGVLVQSSCSSRVSAEAFFGAVIDAAQNSGGRIEEIERTGHAIDHPIGFAQGAYLKTLFAYVSHPSTRMAP